MVFISENSELRISIPTIDILFIYNINNIVVLDEYGLVYYKFIILKITSSDKKHFFAILDQNKLDKLMIANKNKNLMTLNEFINLMSSNNFDFMYDKTLRIHNYSNNKKNNYKLIVELDKKCIIEENIKFTLEINLYKTQASDIYEMGDMILDRIKKKCTYINGGQINVTICDAKPIIGNNFGYLPRDDLI